MHKSTVGNTLCRTKKYDIANMVWSNKGIQQTITKSDYDYILEIYKKYYSANKGNKSNKGCGIICRILSKMSDKKRIIVKSELL